MDKIVTYYDTRDELWYAYVDDEEDVLDVGENVIFGYGVSEPEAINDLHDKLVMG